MGELRVETWPIERLVPYARNPRRNDEHVDRMASAIREFGFRIPVVARSDGGVVDGHLRLKAAKQLGLTTVPVALADELTDAQIKAFRLLANQSTNWAEWDTELLKLEIEDLQELDYDLALTGFEPGELAELTGAVEDAGGLTDPDAVPDVADGEPPVSTPGDLWCLGNHRLLCGDSTDAGNVALLMDGQKADMVFTDPPYNVAGRSRNYVANANVPPSFGVAHKRLSEAEWDKNFDITHTLERILESISNNVTVYICTARYVAHSIWEWMDKNFNFCSYCVWSKSDPLPSLTKRHWSWNTELVCYATKGRHIFNFPEEGHALSTWTIAKARGEGEHPTRKPVAVPEHAIVHSSTAGQSILDLFGGSGTTLIACEKTGRKCYMMEISPHYCDVIVRRWQDFTDQKAVHEGSGKTFDEMAGDCRGQ